MMPPSPNGDNGRDASGRFAKGNTGGPGNPHAGKVAKLRSVMLESVTEEDMRAIVAKLVEQAKAGDLAATKLLLERLLGRTAAESKPNGEHLPIDKVGIYLPFNSRGEAPRLRVLEDDDWYGNGLHANATEQPANAVPEC